MKAWTWLNSCHFFLLLAFHPSWSTFTHQQHIRRLSVQSLTGVSSDFFSVQLRSLHNSSDTTDHIVYSSKEDGNLAKTGAEMRYCHDHDRLMFVAVNSSQMIITTGFQLIGVDAIVEITCERDHCKLHKRKLLADDIYSTHFEHMVLKSAKTKRSMTENLENSAPEKKMFHIRLLVMIDSQAVKEHCRRQFSSCCKTSVNSDNLCPQIRDYYMNMMNAARRLFADVDTEQMSLLLSVVGIEVIPEKKGDSYFSQSTETNSDGTFLNLQKAMRNAVAQSVDASKNYPPGIAATVVFVGHDLKGKNGASTIGGAYKGTVCTRNKVVLVEERYGYVPFFTVTHELGHTLGSEHDGMFADCGSTTNMLMGWTFNKDDPGLAYVFSCCSLAQIYYSLGRAKCIAETATNVSQPSSQNNKYLGQLLSTDEYCKLTRGGDFKACPLSDYPNRNNICKGVRCVGTNGRCQQNFGVPALNGMPCRGNSHWCLYGDCVAKSQPTKFTNRDQRNCDVSKVPRQRATPNEKKKSEFSEAYGGWVKLFFVSCGLIFCVIGTVFYTNQSKGSSKEKMVAPQNVRKSGQSFQVSSNTVSQTIPQQHPLENSTNGTSEPRYSFQSN